MSTNLSTQVDSGDDIAAVETIRLGMRVSPELREGLVGTLLLAVVSTMGQVVVPIAIQQTLDHGLNGPGGRPDVDFMIRMGLVAGLAIVVTSIASYAMTTRLFTATSRPILSISRTTVPFSSSAAVCHAACNLPRMDKQASGSTRDADAPVIAFPELSLKQ